MSPRLATAALVAVTFVWGTTFVVVKEAVDRLPVLSFNGWRFAVAALVLGVIVRRRLPLLGRLGVVHGVILGTALWAGYAFQTFGLELTTAPKAAFITGMVVVLTPLFQAAVLREAPSRAAVIGVALAAAGLAFLTLEGSLVPSLGDVLVFGCACSFALHLIGLGAWSNLHPAGPLATVQLVTVAALSAIGGGVQDAASEGTFAWIPGDVYVWLAVIGTAVFASAFAFVAQTAAQKVLSPTRTAVIFTMEPVFAWLTSWVGVPLLLTLGIAGLAAETFGPREAVGAALILAGMLWSELRTDEPPDALAAGETAALTASRDPGS